MPLRAPVVVLTELFGLGKAGSGSFNWVSVSWQPVLTNTGPVTYEVRKARVDPATPGAAIGYAGSAPVLQPDGSFATTDREADLHLPTWYKVTTRSSAQGSIDSPWYRRNPPSHRGVDSIVGGYWRAPTGSWVGMFCISRVPGASGYWSRAQIASGAWVDLATGQTPGDQRPVATFDPTTAGYASLFQALEGGGQIVAVQVGPIFSTGAGPGQVDRNHLQPMLASVIKTTTAPATRCSTLVP
jgi:hypothetical protein